MGAILISFGPFWDTMFKIFIVLGIFAFAGITFQYVEVEIRSWFGKKDDEAKETRDPENDVWRDELQHVPEELYEKAVQAMRTPPMTHYTIENNGTVVNNMTGEALEPDSTSVVELDVVSKYPDAYLVQWGSLEDFSRLGETDIVRTYEPQKACVDLINKHGAGFLRWRLAGDDTIAPEWIHLSYFTPEYVKDVYNLEPPKEKVNG